MLDTRIIELKPYSGAARDNFYFALDSQDLGTKRVSFKWLCDHLGGSGGDVSGKADKVGQGHQGNLASFTPDGNLADSRLPVNKVATKDDLRGYQPHRAELDTTKEFTADEKAKLGGIEANANKYVHPQFTSRDKGLYKVKVNGEGHVVDATPVTKSDITALGIPAQDTVYDADTSRGISRQNGKLGHINSVNPGTVGPTEGSEEGNSFVIPCITYDAQGHITGAENRRHTISGVIPESAHDDNILSGDSDGTVSWKRLVSAAFGSVSLWLSYKNLEFAARRAYEDEDGNNIKMALADRATMAEVNAAIEEALAKYGGFKIVPRDPNTGEPVVAEPSNRFIYLTKIASSKKDRYEEWIWAIDESDPSVGAWECIGETSIDLSGYVKNITLAGWTEPLAVTQNGVTIPLAVNDGASGLMSGADKKKLDGIEAGAQANVKPDWNAPESDPEGILHKPSIPAAAKNGALNITVGSANAQTFTADQDDNAPVNVNIPLAGKDTSGTVPVYSEGLMSADQNKKLDEIEAGAQANVKPDWDAAESDPEGILHKPSIPAAAKNGALNITVGSANAQTFTADQDDNAPVNVNIPLASKTTEGGTTTYAEGLMSAEQNRKLDEIEAGAEANTIEGVSVNGTDLTPDPSTKVVDIPAAGYSTSGATTTYTDGAMTGEDKEKLDNLKNFSKIVLSDGASTPTLQEVVPTDDDDTLTLVAGNGVTMTKDPDSNKVTVSSSAQPMTISEGPGITVTPTTDPDTHVTDFEIGITGIDALGSLSGSGVVVNPAPVSASSTQAKVDLIPASAIPSFIIPNDRIKLIEDPNDGHVYLCALKTISDPDPSQAVYGVDTFSVSVNVRTDHNPVRSGVFGETCVQVSRIMDGTNTILGQSMATFPMERGAATDNLTLTIRNTSGMEYTDPDTGLVYYRYLLEYIGDGITDPTAESLSIHTYLSAIEETVGISEYNSSQSSYTEGAGIVISPNDNSISVNAGPGLEVNSLTNKVGVKVKPGGGVAIDPTDGISVILEGSAQEAVEIAKATQETIDERIITNMSFSEIHDSFNYASDFNVSGNSQFYATLFTPVMTQEVKAGAKIGIYMRQPGSQGEFALAIYEFDFNNPTQINLVCHTDFQWCGNYAEATSGNNVSAFREIPITYIDPDRNKMKSENLYYAAIITKMDNNNDKCTMQGIFGTTGYSSPLNGIPRLTLAVDNFASTAAQAYSNLNNTGLHQYYGTLDSSIGSELANTRRLFMSIRNIHQSA